MEKLMIDGVRFQSVSSLTGACIDRPEFNVTRPDGNKPVVRNQWPQVECLELQKENRRCLLS